MSLASWKIRLDTGVGFDAPPSLAVYRSGRHMRAKRERYRWWYLYQHARYMRSALYKDYRAISWLEQITPPDRRARRKYVAAYCGLVVL